MVEVTEKGRSIDRQLERFGRFEKRLSSPQWVYPMRKASLARFAELGFPTASDEDWRFTNVTPIARLPFKPVFDPKPSAVTSETIAAQPFGTFKAIRLVFVDGHFAPALSSTSGIPGRVIVSSLASALANGVPELQKHLARHADEQKQPFTALNTAFFQDGAFILVPDGVELEVPVHLLFITASDEQGATTSPRVLLMAGNHSKMTVLEHYAGISQGAYLTNTVTELIVGEGASVEHCRFQDESPAAFHVSALHAEVGASANVISHSICLGAKIARNNIRTALVGPGLQCTLNGLYLTRKDQLADHHMVVEHIQPHCESHEYFNGILDERSKGVFHGRILVRPDAQKTDAKQTNKNLLLSDTATVDTKPQLEIYADDVKCTHGATVGQINEDSIFYLRARGIGIETARHMLIHAFAGEIIDRIRHQFLREEMDRIVWDRLESNPLVGTAPAVQPVA